MRVGIIGCGLIGRKRAQALGTDELVGCMDIVPASAAQLAEDFNAVACATANDLFQLDPDVVIIATTHDRLAN